MIGLEQFFSGIGGVSQIQIAGNEEFLEKHFDLLPLNSDHYARKRKLEYTAGRYCVREALAQINIHDFTVNSGEHREPIWPKGVVGSITHNQDLAFSVVDKNLAGIGIDIEQIIEAQRFFKLKSQFVSEKEDKSLDVDHKIGTLIFSAKEALFKALYPLVGEYFGFMDAEVIEISDTYITLKLLRSDNKFQALSAAYQAQYILLDSGYLTLIKVP